MSGARDVGRLRALTRIAACLAVTVGVVAGAPASTLATSSSDGRTTAPSVIVMSFPALASAMEREPVEFDHAAHSKALESQGCEACHSVRDGKLDPRVAATADIGDRDALIDAYHDACIGCHGSRSRTGLKAGPVTCGECHVRRPPAVSERAMIQFDYSLHGRHAQAYPDRCDPCHHVLDETTKKLVYIKGTEEACAPCHGPRDEEAKLSLQNAAHVGCVSCHLQRTKDQLEAGPVLCVGCHDAGRIASIKRLDPVPRLMRGQPDTLWVHSEGVKSRMVPFDHLSHEHGTSSCSDCHHAGMKPCGDCHTVPGTSSGGGVTLERSQHMTGAGFACVGCHLQVTRTDDCRGCHRELGPPPDVRSCGRCHVGPLPTGEAEEPPPPTVAVPHIAPLPPSSDDFPESVEIGSLAKRYAAAKLPHRKIVERLDAAARKGSLAPTFHGSAETLCVGCHHHAPIGARPADCGSCHGDAALAAVDKPGLMVAYHRQCIGCHQQMRIDKLGCTDCHGEREERT